MKTISIKEALLEDKPLIIDNALSLSRDINTQLTQIFQINDLDYRAYPFDHDYVQATNLDVIKQIQAHRTIIVNTSFTNIKSKAVEELFYFAINSEIKDKRILSLMPFSVVGHDFEDYKNEVTKLGESNVTFWFISEDFTSFELYEI